MDINPLIMDEHEIIAVDARIRVDYPRPSTDPYHHLAIHPYPAHLSTRIQLSDGTDIVIRPIRAEDADMEQSFVRKLSPEAKYFSSVGEEQIGVARYTTNLDLKSCEFALVVADEWQGHGIGYQLMQKLMEIARDRGLERMEGQVLANNTRMLNLMRSLNFRVDSDPEDVAIKRVEIGFN
jgi:acetyltransferase